jgi:endoglucanase
VDSQFGKLKSRFVDGLGIPLILGEFAAQSRLSVDSSQTYRTYWDKYIAHSAWSHGAVPIYWDAGATGDHSTGLFNRAAAVQTYPKLISTIVNAAK